MQMQIFLDIDELAEVVTRAVRERYKVPDDAQFEVVTARQHMDSYDEVTGVRVFWDAS